MYELQKKKDLIEKYKLFCNATIKGVRNRININIFIFYLIVNHSELYKNLENKTVFIL